MFIYILVLFSLLKDIAMEISVNDSQKYINQPMPRLVSTIMMTSSQSNEKRPTK